MRWALAVFLCVCGGAVAPTPSPVPTPTAHVFDARDFTVSVFYGDESDQVAAIALEKRLPEAWAAATSGRSHLRSTNDAPDVYVFLGDEPPARVSAGVQSAWFFAVPSLRFVYVHKGVSDPTVVVHELGHILGSPHWTDCANPSVEIMCAFQGNATTFSDRELRAMGL